jgi:hypothetical protein
VSRLFWVGLGAAAGVLVVRRLTAVAQAVTPAGLSASLGESVRELGDAVRYFTEQVRAATAEREHELYTVLGVDTTDRPAGIEAH